MPLLPWEWAAYLATGAEIILPILLFVGVFTRLSALALFVFNAVAVYSYPAIWGQGFYDHRYWGALCLVLICWGAGKLSIDYARQLKAQNETNTEAGE